MISEDRFFLRLEKRGLVLTPEQRRSARHVEGPLVIHAGPGSGKTATVTARAAYLNQVAGIPADQIAIVTFTRKGSMELAKRLVWLSPELSGVLTGTFHSLFLRWLIQYRGETPGFLSETERHDLVAAALRRLDRPADEESVLNASRAISLEKNRLETSFSGGSTPGGPPLIEYERLRIAQNRWDYDDILRSFWTALREDESFAAALNRRPLYLTVDEFQDTNPVQWESIRLLCQESGRLTVVGDGDQSIYGFRGAQPGVFQSFLTDFPHAESISLGHNFRSTDPIVRFSSSLLVGKSAGFRNLQRGVRGDGPGIEIHSARDEKAEADLVLGMIRKLPQGTGRTIGVLARTHRQLMEVSAMLEARRRDFQTPSQTAVLQRDSHVRIVLEVLRLAAEPGKDRPLASGVVARWESRGVLQPCGKNGRTGRPAALSPCAREWLGRLGGLSPKRAADEVSKAYRAFRTGAGKPGKGDADNALGTLSASAPDSGELREWLEDLQKEIESFEKTAIRLHTFHAAKGLEFNYVFVVGAHDRAVPHQRAQGAQGEPDPLAEERRLLYVACTRAKDRLFITYPLRNGRFRTGISPFLRGAVLFSRRAKRGVARFGDYGRAWSGPSDPAAVPSAGTVVYHFRFGPGTVDSTVGMQDNRHRIDVLFPGGHVRHYCWESAVRSGVFSAMVPHAVTEEEKR